MLTIALVALALAAGAFVILRCHALPQPFPAIAGAARHLAAVLGAAVGAVMSGAAGALEIAVRLVRLALAWLIGFPAVALLCIAVVLCFLAVSLLPKR